MSFLAKAIEREKERKREQEEQQRQKQLQQQKSIKETSEKNSSLEYWYTSSYKDTST